MKWCPKCGGGKIIGPHYEKDSLYGERLRYRCYTCGYSTTTATLDEGKATDARFTPTETGKA